MNKITIFSFYSGKHTLTQGISFIFTSFSLAHPGSLAFSVPSLSNNVLCPFCLGCHPFPFPPSSPTLLASHRPCLSGTTLAPVAVLSLSLSPLCYPSLCPPHVSPPRLSLYWVPASPISVFCSLPLMTLYD